MKTNRTILWVLFIVLGAAVGESALAQRHGRSGHGRFVGHVGIGISLGYPIYGPRYYAGPPYFPYYPYYAYPYYYPPVMYPPVVVTPPSPPAYIERSDSSAAPAPAQSDWFYCPDAKGYYPYVQQCPGGWQRVPSQPLG